jgi:SRSO17 transposase
MERAIDVGEVRGWAAGLEAVHARIAPRFVRPEPRRRALAYLRGLLGPAERKNGWQLAEAAGEATPDGVQRLLATAAWDADAVRDDLRAYVVEHLGGADAVLVVDETGFLKKGGKSVGVQRQYSGTAGRIENCQVGVFLAYASATGRAFLDRELYLPEAWAADAGRREEAGVPPEVAFRTKPQLARAMLERALDAGVPASWVTGDEVYGGDRRLRVGLEERDVPHVLAVKRTEPLVATTARGPAQVAAEDLVAALPAEAWHRLSAGDGAKGPRYYDWARAAIRPLSDPDRGYWLLVRRSLADPADRAHYVCYGPAASTLADLVRVAGARWAVEEAIEAAKGEVGLDEYEVRKWDGWYRHVTLCLLAHAFLAATRARAVGGGKGGRR